MILQASDINKSFTNGASKLRVLTNLSLTVGRGEIVTIMGQSGAGKSTLLNILGTLDSPTNYSGNITIDNIHITPEHDLSNIRALKLGFVFQFHHLLPEFTIMENLQIPRLISGQVNNDSEIMDMLLYIGLEDRKHHYPDEISGFIGKYQAWFVY
jgi:ABC-type lipoprotein export system ATPase subunit